MIVVCAREEDVREREIVGEVSVRREFGALLNLARSRA
jgi:hypothetical protein